MKGKKGTKSPGARGRIRTELTTQIGKAARGARLRFGLTQEDIAERVGIAAEVYGRVERGDMLPATPTLRNICAALGISADLLVGLAGPETTQAQTAPIESDTPEIRRLMRVVRTMDDDQLAVFRGTAAGLLKLNKKRQRRKRDRSQVAVT
jgi:transcriptional regulator with XRE-family HTH domain